MSNHADGTLKRLSQLCEGTRAAAAALPMDHRPLGERVTEVADRLQAVVDRLASDGSDVGSPEAGQRSADALADIERLHFDLIKLEVRGGDPGSLGIEAKTDEMAKTAARLDELAAAGDPGPEPG